VIDSRKSAADGWVRRRRICEECDARWTTVEVPEVDIRVAADAPPPSPEDGEC
jgi:transcriptional regulator NrdR family protein